ncbi:MAG: hypothetical protein AseanaTS_01560 [Candidatus Pelagadaptatus aseana]
MLLLLSAAMHYLWLASNDQVKPLEISGGSQQLPVSMALSMVTIEAAPEPKAAPIKPPEKNFDRKVEALPDPARPEKPELENKVIQVEGKQPEQVVEKQPEDVAQEPTPQLQAKASAQEKKTDVTGLESLPVVKQAGFRSRPSPPVYPKLSLRKRQQGEALVQALVNKEGKTQQVKLVRSSGYPLLDNSALRAVEGWEFKAALVDDVPVMAWVEVPVAFQINR